jgi:hypothetical protein
MEQTTSTIRYSLRENRLPVPNAPACVAQVHGYKTVTRDMLVAIMANANTTVSRQDIIVVLDLLESTVKQELLNGNRVVTNLFSACVSITGGFDSPDAEFDKTTNRVKVNMNTARGLQNWVDYAARTEKIRGKARVPEVDRVFDFTSATANATVTPGAMAELKGCNLFLTGSDSGEGIYFVEEETNTAVKVETIHRKTSGTVLFTVPAGMTAGTYTVSVRCGFGSELRTGSLKQSISVN